MKLLQTSFQSKLWKGIVSGFIAFAGALGIAQAQPSTDFTVTATGPTSSMTLTGTVKVADAYKNQTGNFYVAANVNGAWFGLTQTGWETGADGAIPVYRWKAAADGVLPVYSTESLNDKTIQIVANRSMLAYVGAQVYVGYGLNQGNMLDPADPKYNKTTPYVIPQDPNLHLLQVGSTDAGIQYQPDAYHMYRTCDNNQCVDDNKLFVFFPGSGGSATDFQRLADVIGHTGIRVLVLAYDNDGTIASQCDNLDDFPTLSARDACYASIRQARVLGSDSASEYVPSAADGIKNRLLRALMKLNWTQFYSGDQLLVNKMIVGGFSQGAGMAAWAAKNFPVSRVCQFGGTWDGTWDDNVLQFNPAPEDRTTNEWHPASWLYQGSATPPSSFYGFAHQYDSGRAYGIKYLDLNWQALAMSGTPRLYTQGLSGQKIYTDESQCNGPEHECSVQDSATPLNADGTSKFADVWKYVCGR